jgi:hypothetical protein
MATIEACIDVNVPVQTAYDQWKQFEKCPPSIEGVKKGKPINIPRCVETQKSLARGS